MGDFKEKMKNWADEALENSYSNTVKILADGEIGKAAREMVAKAQENLKDIESEWERRRQLAANNRYTPDRPEKGVLARLGYHVGNEGEKTTKRRIILERAVNGILPFVPNPAYMDEWGEPGTEQRLGKLAMTIAFFVRDKKKYKDEKYAKAIIEWEEDLEWLRKEHYSASRHKFSWPNT
jgi:hypothetical protein